MYHLGLVLVDDATVHLKHLSSSSPSSSTFDQTENQASNNALSVSPITVKLKKVVNEKAWMQTIDWFH
jgi:hypothetical protein